MTQKYLLCLITLFSATGALAAPDPITIEDMWAIERVGTPVASPDGRQIAFTLTRFSMADNSSNVDIWLVPSDGSTAPRQLTRQPGSDSAPVFSPDGKSLAFLSARDGKPAQLFRLPLDGGEAEALTDWPTGIRRALWHPDGMRLIVEATTWPDLNGDATKVGERLATQKADLTQAKASESRAFRHWDRYLTDGTRSHLFELDLKSRTLTDRMPGFDRWVNPDGFEWDLSPDGSRVAYAANSTEPPHRSLNYDLYLLDLKTGQTRNITSDRPGGDGRPVFAPDGQRIVFSGTRRVDVPSDLGRLVTLDLKSGAHRELLPDFEFPVSAWRFDRAGVLYFHAEQAGKVNLFRMDGEQAQKLVDGGTTDGAAPLGNGAVAFARQGFSNPPELAVLRQGRVSALTNFNGARMAALKLGRVDDVRHPGVDGKSIQMFVAYPPDFVAGKKYPLLMLAHGGPFSAWLDSFNFRWNAQVFAAQGYIVALPNWHGSTGFGQAFTDALLGAHGEKSMADTLKATDWLIEQGAVDADRMAIAGGSYGGYLTALITGETDRFKAAINHAGVFDLSGQFASDSSWDRPTSYGAAPWTDPVALDRWSPSLRVPKMVTPTLILHGELDYRVPVTQGINHYGALVGKGVRARIVVFPTENHWILKPQASRLWYGEFFGWLKRYVP